MGVSLTILGVFFSLLKLIGVSHPKKHIKGHNIQVALTFVVLNGVTTHLSVNEANKEY